MVRRSHVRCCAVRDHDAAPPIAADRGIADQARIAVVMIVLAHTRTTNICVGVGGDRVLGGDDVVSGLRTARNAPAHISPCLRARVGGEENVFPQCARHERRIIEACAGAHVITTIVLRVVWRSASVLDVFVFMFYVCLFGCGRCPSGSQILTC